MKTRSIFALCALLLVFSFGFETIPVRGQDVDKKVENKTDQKKKKQDRKKRTTKKNDEKKTNKSKVKTKSAKANSDKKTTDKDKTQKTKLELKNFFPEKSPFGPSASSSSFSKDGRYAAFLYRPYLERRHGSDLYVYDFEKEEIKRLTSVSVMATFQERTRKVKDDRLAKHKKAAATKKSSEATKSKAAADQKSNSKNSNQKSTKSKSVSKKSKGKKTDSTKDNVDHKLIDTVTDKDADDSKSPRYSGISSFTWNPKGHDILFTSGGDIYQLKLDGKPPVRLTRTKDSERSVQFLPDGKGYMFMRDSNLFRVRFGEQLIEQIDPVLGSDEELRSYRISPNGNRLVLQVRKGKDPFSSDRKVKIVNYRGRFAEVREFNRTVSDDPVVEQEVKIYFYDLTTHENEESELKLVYSTKLNSPRDAVSTPSWSLDSNHVTFADFHFEDENVGIYTATYPSENPSPKTDTKNADAKKSNEEKSDESKSAQSDEKTDSKDDSSTVEKKQLAKLQYRFLHFGGPNTPRMIQPQFLADNNHVVFMGEQSGFRHLHVLDTIYQTVNPLTQGNFEVYLEEMSDDRKFAFVTSTKNSPSRTMIYRVDVASREMVAISDTVGSYSNVAVSQDGKKSLANYVTFGKLTELVRINEAKKKDAFKVLTKSHSPKAAEITKPIPEFFTYKNRHGQELHGNLFKPSGWKKTDKRPCLIYVYGGPLGTRHSVNDGSYRSDSYFFAYYMAEKHGFVTVTIDPRGQSGYGGLFEKSNFEQVGKPQVEDLVDGVSHLVKNYGVDKSRVGLHGWSFGGFQTQMCLYTEPDVFAAGIAGAGPTEWENYNKWYSTGTIGRSAVGKTDQKKFSLLPLAKNLKAKLLLVHGMEDSNVLYQDTVRVYRELIKAGKETLVELFLDPTGNHGLGGDVKRLAKYRKYEEFLVRTLGVAKVDTNKGKATDAKKKADKSEAKKRAARKKQAADKQAAIKKAADKKAAKKKTESK